MTSRLSRGAWYEGTAQLADALELPGADGDFYYSSLHTGATAWYILASRGIDPFLVA